MPFKNPEDKRAYKRSYERRPEVVQRRKAYLRAYYQRPEIREKMKARDHARRHRWASYQSRKRARIGRKQETERYRELRDRLRRDVLALYGNACPGCGFAADPRALQIDHVNDDGAMERRTVSPRSLSWYRNVIRSVQAGENRYQVLCCNCNWLKRYRDGK